MKISTWAEYNARLARLVVDLCSPNKDQRWPKLIEQLQKDQEEHGECYWWEISNVLGAVVEVRVLPAQDVSIWDLEGTTGYVVSSATNKALLPPEQVVHFRVPKDQEKVEQPIIVQEGR